MKVAVVGAPDSWYLQDLVRAAGRRHQVTPVAFSTLRSSGEYGSGCDGAASGAMRLNDFDAVLVRTMPPGSLEQVVFRMDVLGRLAAGGKPVLNPPRSLESAIDKYLATEKLREAGLPTPETFVCQTVEDAMQGYHQLGGDVVIKPLFGSEGRGIARVSDEALAWRAFKMLAAAGAVIYLQKFIEHEGCDWRLLVIGERVWGMCRRSPTDWRTNISRGARAEPLEVTDELAEMAHRAAAAIGAPLAGVDLLPARDGGLYALEVNAVPGWKALSRVLELDVAARVWDFLCNYAGPCTADVPA